MNLQHYTGWVKKNWHLCYSFEYQMYQFFLTHPVQGYTTLYNVIQDYTTLYIKAIRDYTTLQGV
jgi:hypothetical protein